MASSVVSLSLVATVQESPTVVASEIAPATSRSNEVPFKLHRGYAVVVRGSAGDLKDLNFLIDTGAVPSVLDRRIAESLRLTGTTEELSVFTDKLKSQSVVAPNVEVGPLHTDALRMVVRDLSFAKGLRGTRIDGMIGLDFLGKGPFTIDYKSKKIIFVRLTPR